MNVSRLSRNLPIREELLEFINRENAGNREIFANLLACLMIQPSSKSEFEDIFTKATIRLCDQLFEEIDLRRDQLISTYLGALELYPNNLILLNAYGATLAR